MKKTLKIAILLWLTMVFVLMMASCDEFVSNLPIINEILPDVTTPENFTTLEGFTTPENFTPPEETALEATTPEETTPIPHVHTEELIQGVAPTCTESGLSEGKRCSACGDILTAQEIIPANGHTEVIDKAVAPTCNQTGLTEGKHCSACGEVLIEQTEISIIEHNYKYVVDDPTTSPTVVLTYTCEGCNDTYTQTVTPTDFTVTYENRSLIGFTESTTDFVIPAVFQNNGIWYRVTSIGMLHDWRGSFDGCTNLTSITIPNSVTHIGYGTFAGCTNLSEITISDSVTIIGDLAFAKCSNLTSITIPNGVTSIGFEAFWECKSLTSITIPNSVTSISSVAFRECFNLTSIIVEKGNPVYYSDGGCLIEKTSGTLLFGRNLSVIPEGIINVGDYAFEGCANLTSITIPDSVRTIGNGAFCGCDNLITITIPDGVTSIGKEAFYACYNLTSITLPFVGNTKDGTKNTRFDYIFGGHYGDISTSLKTVVITGGTTIADYAFSDCSGLTSITIPDSVTTIGFGAFEGCSSLESIVLPFVGKTKDGTDKLYLGYIFGEYLRYFNDAVPASLKNVVITGGTTIGPSAFSGCRSLTSIKLPDGLTTIGSYAFEDCSALTNITIPENVKIISRQAFYNCRGLTSIKLPDNLTTIASLAFYNCRGLTSIKLPDNLTAIADSAFEGCSGLTSITIPDSVTTIRNKAFYNCSGLTSIIFEDTSTWYRTKKNNMTGGESTSVTDISINATYFKSKYYDYHWYKK